MVLEHLQGGYHSRPKMTVPGGILVGQRWIDVFTKIKEPICNEVWNAHTESIFETISESNMGQDLLDFEDRLKSSWIETDLYKSRNITTLLLSMVHLWEASLWR